MAKLTCAVVTYNQYVLLHRCLRSLELYTFGVDDLVVVNNNPSPEYREIVEAQCAQVNMPLRVLHLDRNRRASGAINAALETTKAEYLAVVSDDVMFVPGNLFWPSMMKVCKDPQVGLVGPTIDRGSSPLQLAAFFVNSDYLQTNYLMGMFLMARTAVWKEIGGCDENLEGTEEADLALLTMKAGYRLIINRQVFLCHEGAATMKTLYDEEAYQARGKRAGDYVVAKHGPEVFFNPHLLPGFPRDGRDVSAPMTYVDPESRQARHVALTYYLSN